MTYKQIRINKLLSMLLMVEWPYPTQQVEAVMHKDAKLFLQKVPAFPLKQKTYLKAFKIQESLQKSTRTSVSQSTTKYYKSLISYNL